MAGFSNADFKSLALGSFLPGGYANFGFAGTVPVVGAPVVTLVSPLTGKLNSSDALVLDVTDFIALRRVLIVARFASLGGAEELIYNGSRFASFYAGSTASAITGGLRYSLIRKGGWPADLIIDVYAIDTTGSEA